MNFLIYWLEFNYKKLPDKYGAHAKVKKNAKKETLAQ